MELIENNCTSTNVFRKIFNKTGLKGGIQAINIESLQMRALRLRFSGKKLTIDDVTQWIERPGLVEYLPHMMMNVDMAITQAKEILQNVLQ